MKLTNSGQLFLTTGVVTLVCFFLYTYTPFVSMFGPKEIESKNGSLMVDDHEDILYRKNAVNEMGFYIKHVSMNEYARDQTAELSRNDGALKFVQSVSKITKDAITKQNPMGFTGSDVIKGDPIDVALRLGLGRDAAEKDIKDLTAFGEKLKTAYSNEFKKPFVSPSNANDYDQLNR